MKYRVFLTNPTAENYWEEQGCYKTPEEAETRKAALEKTYKNCTFMIAKTIR